MEDKRVTLLCDAKIFTVDGLIDENECMELISRSEARGFNISSPSGGGHGRTGREDARTSQFCVLNDEEYAKKLWRDVEGYLPPDLTHLSDTGYITSQEVAETWRPISVNPHLRIYKYEVGDVFPEHIDYKFRRIVWRGGEKYEQMTFMTYLCYLNDDFQGGHTGFWTQHDKIGIKEHCRFLRGSENKPHQVVVIPKTGMVVINDQNLLHEALPPTKGVKYVLRTDIVHERHIAINEKIRKYMTDNDVCDRLGDWERLFETSCKNYAD